MVDDMTPSASPPRNREVLSTWKPLFANAEVSWAEQTEASRERQFMAATRMDTVEATQSVTAPGFSDVQVEDLQEIVGQQQQQPTIEEMLEEGEEQYEPQATQEDDIKPGEPTTRQLTEVLTSIARLSEQLEEYDNRPHPRNLICPALINGHLRKAQPVITDLANITLGDDDGTTYDDIEVLGDLLVEELPQDFEGFDAKVRGGVNEGAGRKQ
ncbi:hypothetical protein Hamer_G021069 [Homarus americanus]|uniref:Uncharacterized protein n=1 Tax=Homarus americanus TaxID=6706 RepID=A0A8J5JMZ3_HOMAM|nr:hypothetical protein Hamer_G021069 [Homarus americanus]